MIRTTVSAFEVPSEEQRQHFLTLQKTPAVCEATIASLPCMNAARTGGKEPGCAIGFPFTVAAWNMERCLFPQASAEKLKALGHRWSCYRRWTMAWLAPRRPIRLR